MPLKLVDRSDQPGRDADPVVGAGCGIGFAITQVQTLQRGHLHSSPGRHPTDAPPTCCAAGANPPGPWGGSSSELKDGAAPVDDELVL